MIEFDLLNAPLRGRNLIEASAGTGKTYAIEGLFVRLVVEKGLTVDRILVVTFTEAATGELRDRIRRRIRGALDAFTNGYGGDDILSGLLARVADPESARARLELALHSFDEAAIHTIHGFCRRILGEMAFEAGSLFDTDLTADALPMVRGIVEDFWRSRMVQADPALVKWVNRGDFAPDELTRFAARWGRRPGLSVLPDGDAPETGAPIAEYLGILKRARAVFEGARDDIRAILEGDPGLNRNKYRTTNVGPWMDQMDAWLNDPLPLELFKNFKKFRAATIEESLKAGAAAPTHSFFDLCDDLNGSLDKVRDVMALKVSVLKRDLLQYVRAVFPSRKHALNIRTFDDLLLDLDDALSGEGGAVLARALRDRHPAALVDEFQDTDPVQFSIFSRIYGTGDSTLFFIGDPKQAIYGFRGADVFAYMAAKSDVPKEGRGTLTTNWRSAPSLIDSVNAVFGTREHPFLFRDIGFDPASPAGKEDRETLYLDGRPDAHPFQLWKVEPENDKPVGKGKAERLIRVAVASEIVRLLNRASEGNVSIGDVAGGPEGGRPLEPGDIAILVRTNAQALSMQLELRSRGVPSVLHGDAGLFESPEAVDVLQLLSGIADPDDQGAVRAALITDIVGLSANELADIVADDVGWARRVETFRRYRDLWSGRSFMAMARALMADQRVREGLLAFEDGERRLTNVLHCFDVLHQASIERKLGVDGLITWLAGQISDGRPSDEYQIRLETDEKAVKLVTIHKSKGLEYPVVFVPYAWGAFGPRKDEPLAFHPREDDPSMVLDLGPVIPAEHQQNAMREAAAEDIRLLYVALTRAKHRCYVAWGAINGSGDSALGRLLPDDLRDLEARSGGHVRVVPLPEPSWAGFNPPTASADELECRRFKGAIPNDWRITSFSRLAARSTHDVEEPDRDASPRQVQFGVEAGPDDGSDRTFMDFPAGARAGTCLHEVFERLDFQSPRSEVVGKVLRRYGFDDDWTDVVLEMARDVLDARVLPDFRLSMLTPAERVHEMEFAFPVGLLEAASLARALPDHADILKRLEFEPHRGQMKGFIDLVFRHEGRYYLLDWKSNLLGRGPGDYVRERLDRTMDRDLYILQSRVYATGLHRHLASRLPGYDYDSHFGGVLYLFLRGVPFGDGCGVWFDRPSGSEIERLNGCFDGKWS
ncbi:MAG: exodeoxyribonuclease V subunit beta [Deltaproteobacteria bacterium]|nr:exodeoxyribonuclease V subunit beta [Deltaproteobacteria bacterium]